MLGGEIGNFAIQYGRGDHQWGCVEGVAWSVGADDCVVWTCCVKGYWVVLVVIVMVMDE